MEFSKSSIRKTAKAFEVIESCTNSPSGIRNGESHASLDSMGQGFRRGLSPRARITHRVIRNGQSHAALDSTGQGFRPEVCPRVFKNCGSVHNSWGESYPCQSFLLKHSLSPGVCPRVHACMLFLNLSFFHFFFIFIPII